MDAEIEKGTRLLEHQYEGELLASEVKSDPSRVSNVVVEYRLAKVTSGRKLNQYTGAVTDRDRVVGYNFNGSRAHILEELKARQSAENDRVQQEIKTRADAQAAVETNAKDFFASRSPDLIAKVLNYSDGCGDAGPCWYKKSNCVYAKAVTTRANTFDPEVRVIDLNSLDPQYIKVGVNEQNTFVEHKGKPLFSVNRAWVGADKAPDQDRLLNGWAKIYGECRGHKADF